MSIEFTRLNKLKRAAKNKQLAKEKNELASTFGRYGVKGTTSIIKKLRRGAQIHNDRAAVLRMQAKR